MPLYLGTISCSFVFFLWLYPLINLRFQLFILFHLDKQIYILEQWTLFTGSEVGIYERKQESHQEKKKKRKQALDQESKIQ